MTDKIQVTDSAGQSPAGHEDKMAAAAAGVSIKHSDQRDGQTEKFEQQADPHANKAEDSAHSAPAGDTDDAPERPDWCPEKFWNAEKGEVDSEALAKSYGELERTRNKPADDDSDDDSDDGAGEGTEGEGTEGDNKSAQDNAIERAQQVYAEKGELSDAEYDALEKVGIARDLVDAYIAGQMAAANELRQAAFEHTGGSEEGFNKMASWALENMSDDEVATIDKLLASPDKDLISQGAKMLADRYNSEANITPQNHIQGRGGNRSNGEHYANRTEMMKDMNSPQYKTDENFRQQVARKIANAEKAGVNLFA